MLEAGGDGAALKAAMESWLDQALELRAEFTTVAGLKEAMDAEPGCTCFPVMVREEGEGPRKFLTAWLSIDAHFGRASPRCTAPT